MSYHALPAGACGGGGGGYGYDHGTSLAAPYISGVLAPMMEAFGDQLSNKESAARLLATADNSGIYSNRQIYGRSMVNVEAALSQTRSADMHVEKDYDLGAITLRLRGDARLTGAGSQDARIGVGLYLSLGG